jgi:hypothetical protein
MASSKRRVPAEQPTGDGMIVGCQTCQQIWAEETTVKVATMSAKTAMPSVRPNCRTRAEVASADCGSTRP